MHYFFSDFAFTASSNSLNTSPALRGIFSSNCGLSPKSTIKNRGNVRYFSAPLTDESIP